MSAEEKTTWGEVCSKVGFSDNLYRTCRGKVPGFEPAGGFSGPRFDDSSEVEEDFGKKLRRSALPVPPPPPADWKYEPEGLMESLMYGSATKYILYGSLAAAFFWFFVRPRLGTLMAALPKVASSTPKTALPPATTARAA